MSGMENPSGKHPSDKDGGAGGSGLNVVQARPPATFKDLLDNYKGGQIKVDYKNLPAPTNDNPQGFWGKYPPQMIIFKEGERIKNTGDRQYGIEFHVTVQDLHKAVAADCFLSPSRFDLYLIRDPGYDFKNGMGGIGMGEMVELQLFPPDTTLVELYAFVLQLPFYQGHYQTVAKNKDRVFFMLAEKGRQIQGCVVVDQA